jgi:hypothetical protein
MSESGRRSHRLVVGDTVIYGPSDSFPKPSEFQGLVAAHRAMHPHALTALAHQVVIQAPPKLMSQYLNILVCTYWHLDAPHLSQLADSSPGGGSKICGRIFKRGEIVWTCKYAVVVVVVVG